MRASESNHAVKQSVTVEEKSRKAVFFNVFRNLELWTLVGFGEIDPFNDSAGLPDQHF